MAQQELTILDDCSNCLWLLAKWFRDKAPHFKFLQYIQGQKQFSLASVHKLFHVPNNQATNAEYSV
jgi:hypothetical protein